MPSAPRKTTQPSRRPATIPLLCGRPALLSNTPRARWRGCSSGCSLTPGTMSYVRHLACSACERAHDAQVLQTVCTTCGSPLVTRYDLARVAQSLTREGLRDRPATMWRYIE